MTLQVALVVTRMRAQVTLKLRENPGTLVLDVSIKGHLIHVAFVTDLTCVMTPAWFRRI